MEDKKTPGLDPTMHEPAAKDGEHYEADPAAENGDAKHDLEKNSLSQVATEDQEYFVTVKTWIVVWVRKRAVLRPLWTHS